MTKELIQGLCKDLEGILRLDNKAASVRLFSGWRVENYFLPAIHIGTGIPSDKSNLAWFGEIYVNKVCIFRECRIPPEGEPQQKTEYEVLRKLLLSVFSYGVQAAKDISERLKDLKP